MAIIGGVRAYNKRWLGWKMKLYGFAVKILGRIIYSGMRGSESCGSGYSALFDEFNKNGAGDNDQNDRQNAENQWNKHL